GLRPGAAEDLSGRLRPDGSLDWDAPAGRWTLLRIGYTTTGKTIGPASPESGGLEVDKMDAAAVEDHFEHSLGQLIRVAGDKAGRTLAGVFCDSWEAGRQTWSPHFAADFKQRRGYDIGPWLPAL